MNRYDIALGKEPTVEVLPPFTSWPNLEWNFNHISQPYMSHEYASWRRELYQTNSMVRDYINTLIRATTDERWGIRNHGFHPRAVENIITDYYLLGNAFFRAMYGALYMHGFDSIRAIHSPPAPAIYLVRNGGEELEIENMIHLARVANNYQTFGDSVIEMGADQRPLLRHADAWEFINQWNSHRELQ